MSDSFVRRLFYPTGVEPHTLNLDCRTWLSPPKGVLVRSEVPCLALTTHVVTLLQMEKRFPKSL
jgi:hypothetical protein